MSEKGHEGFKESTVKTPKKRSRSLQKIIDSELSGVKK